MEKETKKTESEEEETKPTDEEKSQAEEMADTIMRLVEAKAEKKAKDAEESKQREIAETKVLTKDMVEIMDKEERVGQFISALLSNDKIRMKVLSEGTNAMGGFLVPTYWYAKIVEDLRDETVVRPRATIIDPCPKQLNISQLASRPKVFWRGEQAIKDTSTATYSQISLTPYSLAVIVILTKELVADAEVGLPQGIITHITNLVVRAIAEEEDKRFIMGTGTTQPTGLETYRAAATITAVATPANIAAYATLVDAFYRLGSKYRQRAVWVMSSATLMRCMQLADTTGRPIFVADPTGNLPGTILGKPVLEQNDLGLGVAYIIDFSGYYIGVREGINVMQSEEASITMGNDSINLFERNEVAIRVEERIDGELADTRSCVAITGMN